MRTELCAISPAIHLLGNRSSLSGLAKFFTENKVRILRIIISLRAEDVAEISPKKSTEDVLIFWFAASNHRIQSPRQLAEAGSSIFISGYTM